jgi:inward rectifier potassium channel
MATRRHISSHLKENTNTGFGTNADSYGGRFLNKDGSVNMRKEGMGFFNRLSLFQTMLDMPLWKFISVILVFYLTANIIFTGIYLFIGINQLQGWIGNSAWAKFKEVYFFSAQTFTTVGYGRVNPVGGWANLVASLEALSGFLSFAIATGLIYGRFAKPKSYLAFSEHALISPYQDKTGLVFRLVSYKENHSLTDVHVVVNLGMQILENDKRVNKYYRLDLERSHVESLPMNWNVVHPIDEKSPLFGFTAEDMATADVELYILVHGFDEVFSSMVQQRTSYVYSEILFNRKFVPMYREAENGKTTILELHKLDEHMEVKPKA